MAKLYFYYSAMNAGKSTMLLQASFNYQERGMQTLLYCPAIDTRYGTPKITSRIGLESNAVVASDSMDLYLDVEERLSQMPRLACVLVDEAHFFSKAQISSLCRIVDELKIPVMCFGLRSDFLGEPFPGSLYLLTWADELVEVKTICHCGSKALMNMRVDSCGNKVVTGAQIQVGGNDLYVAMCRKHFGLDGPRTTHQPCLKSSEMLS